MITPTPQSPFLQVRLKHYNTFPAGAEKATKSTRLGIKPRARGCAGLLRNFFATTHTISATGVTTMSKGRGRLPPQGAPGGVSKQAPILPVSISCSDGGCERQGIRGGCGLPYKAAPFHCDTFRIVTAGETVPIAACIICGKNQF